MEYRKLISFGKNSFVISLPKPWVIQNKLVKGDLIYVEEGQGNLVLHPRQAERSEEDKEIVINIDGKDISRIQREIIPAYINNNKTITLKGKDIKKNAAEIQNLIQNLIALEVMEQTSEKIVARDFLDMKDISITNLIRKMDTITRAMIEDGVKSFSDDNYENILHRDKDVNRLSYLLFRAIRYGFQNQTFIKKKYDLNPMQLMNHYFVTFNIEAVADEAKRITRYMKSIKGLNQKEQKEFERIYTEVRKSYLDTMKAYYTDDSELCYQVASRKQKLIEDSESFFIRNRDVKWTGYLTNRMKRMISSIHKLGRIVYQ